MRGFTVIVSAALLTSCGGTKSDVTKVADEPSTVIGLAADNDGVAWLASGKTDVELKLKQLGTPVVTVTRGSLFHVALDKDAVYWSDGEHIWTSSRKKPEPRQLAEIDDVTVGLRIDGSFVYWALPTKVGRVALTGDAVSQVVIAQPPSDGRIRSLAVGTGHTVIAVQKSTDRTTLWDVAGEPRKIGEYAGGSRGLEIAGDELLWSHDVGMHDEVLSLAFDGTQRAAIDGLLVAATANNVYVARDQATFLVTKDSERRIGARVIHGVVTPERFYAVFGKTIGYVPAR